MSQYKPKYFSIEELVSEKVFLEYAEKGRADLLWNIFDDRILLAADLIREQYGPMTINDWKYGGNCHYRGYREPSCAIGAKLSQHKFGRGLDLIPHDTTADHIRDGILNNEAAAGLVTCVEINITWLHIDCRMPYTHGILQVKG